MATRKFHKKNTRIQGSFLNGYYLCASVNVGYEISLNKSGTQISAFGDITLGNLDAYLSREIRHHLSDGVPGLNLN